jgi:hypothetical protein
MLAAHFGNNRCGGLPSQRSLCYGYLMTENLKDFITRRRIELDELESPLREQLDQIALERDQLRRAALAAGIVDESFAGSSGPAMRSPRRIAQRTLKEAVVEILMTRNGKGMTAREILMAINSGYSADYPRSSLSPQLSRLKSDRVIRRRGNMWFLDLKKTEAPDPDLLKGESGASDTDPEAHGVEAAPGGGR